MFRSLKSIFQTGSGDGLPVMDLDSYRSIYQGYPKPSGEQIKDFVEFVSHAKSWYKHLPLLPPGVPFHFYLDQYAGWKRIKTFGRGVKFVKHKEGDERLHYSHIPTDQYYERFGLLSFSCEVGTRMYDFTITGIKDSNRLYPIIYTSEGQTYQIPKELLEVGSILLTGPIHDSIVQYCLNISHPEYKLMELDKGKWPVESGGEEVLNKIVEIGQLFHKKKSGKVDLDFMSSILEQVKELIAPEQNRLRQKMFVTIKNVCRLIHD